MMTRAQHVRTLVVATLALATVVMVGAMASVGGKNEQAARLYASPHDALYRNSTH